MMRARRLGVHHLHHRGTLCDFAEQDVMAGHALLRRHQCFLIPSAIRRTASASLSRRCCAATAEASSGGLLIKPTYP
jgi:hypothetical protein